MITTLDAIDISCLEFGAPKKNANHYSIHVSATGTDRILIQSPKFELYGNLDTLYDNYTDMVCKCPEFISALKAVDQTMIDVIKSRRDEWFPQKNIDDTFVEVGQVHSVILKNVVRLRVNKNIDIFDSKSKEQTKCTTLEAGTMAKCILHLNGIWFTATRWGITWSIVQMKTYPTEVKKKVYKGYMFPDEDEESDHERDDIDTEPAPPPGV